MLRCIPSKISKTIKYSIYQIRKTSNFPGPFQNDVLNIMWMMEQFKMIDSNDPNESNKKSKFNKVNEVKVKYTNEDDKYSDQGMMRPIDGYKPKSHPITLITTLCLYGTALSCLLVFLTKEK